MTQWMNSIDRRSRSQILVSSAISLALLTASIGFAESLSPVGQWQTVSDVTGKATSIVRISLENGKTYRSELRVTDGREKLEMRGYIGFSLFGRTEVWIRKR